MKKLKDTLPRTFGAGHIAKRSNKQKSPRKFDMWQFLADRGLRFSFRDVSVATLKKHFAETGGLEWWANK
tara:strand:+ start:349 stop:558 length:210 start_codon:yes stop_codon:yes gene_type:complete